MMKIMVAEVAVIEVEANAANIAENTVSSVKFMAVIEVR